MSDLEELRLGMRAFAEERDWSRFHDPKSVLLALVGEVGELAEVLQWLPAGEVTARTAADPELRRRLGEEMSDVLLYLVLLADVLDLDLPAAARAKLAAAHVKHPPHAEHPAQRAAARTEHPAQRAAARTEHPA